MAMTPQEVAIAFSWLPAEALSIYTTAYVDSGNDTVAWATVRKDSRYEQWFPGNMTDDGRPRYAENVYAAVTASYDDVFRSVGIAGAGLNEMREHYGELIAGDVSPNELEENRVAPMYQRIVSQSDAIRSFYAENFGLKMTTEALVASALNPDLGHRILTKQILVSEIGGEAAESGYTLDPEMLGRLAESGKVNRAEADRFFQLSENMLPTLNVLANRHLDPDDTFDINEFVQADIFQDPTERRRINRLMAQEKATFTGGREEYRRSRTTGGVAGLAET